MSKRNCPSCELSDDELLPLLFLGATDGWEYLHETRPSLNVGLCCPTCGYLPYLYAEGYGWCEWIISSRDWKRILHNGDPIRYDI